MLESLSSCYFGWRWTQHREQHSRPGSQGLICFSKHRCRSRRAGAFRMCHVISASPMPQAQLSVELTCFVGSAVSDGSPGTKIPRCYLNLVPQSWALTSTHHLICFSNKMLQICGAWRMLWLNLQWKIDATQICSDVYSPALPAAPLPWQATRRVSRLSSQPAVGLQYKSKARGVTEEICLFCSSLCTVPGHAAGSTVWGLSLTGSLQNEKGGFAWAKKSPQQLRLLLAMHAPSGRMSINSEVTQHPEVQRTVQ